MTTNPFDSREFRDELGNLLDEKLTPLTKLVSAHEEHIQRSRGALWMLWTLWTAIIGFGEYFFHRKP